MKQLILLLIVVFSTSAYGAGSKRNDAKVVNDKINLLFNEMMSTHDTLTYYATLRQAVLLAMSCDSLESIPDERGKVKFQFRNGNYKRLEPLRQKLIDAGLYLHSFRRNVEAITYFKTYVESAESAIFQNKRKRDLYRGQAAYYAALLSYGLKYYKDADLYADLALRDDEYARDAAEIKVSCMKEMMRTPVDSMRYFIALLELHDKAPQNRAYSNMIIDYLSQPGHEKEMSQFAQDELRKDSTNEMNWILYGETLMRQSLWAEAVRAYEKAIQIQPDFLEALYNLAICLCGEAQEVKKTLDGQKPSEGKTLKSNQLSDSRMLVERSYDCLERVRQIDPDRKQVDWAKMLYQVALALGKTKEAEELKGILK